ncbi:MAG: glycosyltransferase family 4 protein [Ignavibacteria bacterium]
MDAPAFAQIKLHKYFGGGEVFARTLCEAAASLGRRSILVVHPEAPHWREFRLPQTELLFATSSEEAVAQLRPGVPLITHAPLPDALAQRVATERVLAGIVHMPIDLYYGSSRDAYRRYHAVVPVSAYVAETLRRIGIEPYPEALYGFADLDRLKSAGPAALEARSQYEWDKRKLRDRLLGATEPLWGRLRRRRVFVRRPGLTLGVVSRIAPIKQFPLLFTHLAPHIARREGVWLEIFGAGGYASMRDLRAALAPLGDKVRYWGFQPQVAAAYAQIDVLLTGLPEREALGLNIIEAQACGVPVLAPQAPPFDETVVEGRTGFFYRDPREDDGADFARLLDRLRALPALPDPRQFPEAAGRFSFAAFSSRVGRLVDHLAALSGAN